VNALVTHFAARLQQARNESGLTASEAASRIGVTERAFRYWEAGTRSPRISQLASLPKAFGKPVAWFFEGAPE
jgi:transcriptional regulator with XRE-family HTH domain